MTPVKYAEKMIKFIDDNPGLYLSTEKLHEILNMYEEWQNCGGNNTFISYRVMPYMTLRTFLADVQDTNYIEKLLQVCYDHGSGRITFFYNMVGADPVLDVTGFFLKHANKIRLEIANKRIVNLMFEDSWVGFAVRGEPDVFLLLLRFGALTTDTNNVSAFLILSRMFHSIINTIKYKTFNGIQFTVLNNTEGLEKMSEIIYSSRTCWKKIKRVCPQVRKDLFFESTRALKIQELNPKEPVPLQMSVLNNILPELASYIFLPLPLKHLCKLRIRKILYKGWLLPEGIEKLDLPQTLKDYLDLLCD